MYVVLSALHTGCIFGVFFIVKFHIFAVIFRVLQLNPSLNTPRFQREINGFISCNERPILPAPNSSNLHLFYSQEFQAGIWFVGLQSQGKHGPSIKKVISGTPSEARKKLTAQIQN
jgi:hypothetical protein